MTILSTTTFSGSSHTEGPALGPALGSASTDNKRTNVAAASSQLPAIDLTYNHDDPDHDDPARIQGHLDKHAIDKQYFSKPPSLKLQVFEFKSKVLTLLSPMIGEFFEALIISNGVKEAEKTSENRTLDVYGMFIRQKLKKLSEKVVKILEADGISRFHGSQYGEGDQQRFIVEVKSLGASSDNKFLLSINIVPPVKLAAFKETSETTSLPMGDSNVAAFKETSETSETSEKTSLPTCFHCSCHKRDA